MLVSDQVIEKCINNLMLKNTNSKTNHTIDTNTKQILIKYLKETIFEFENPSKSPYDLNEEEFITIIDIRKYNVRFY